MPSSTRSGPVKFLRRIEDFRIQSEIRGPALFRIKGSNVSDDAIAELQAALPALVVQPRGPACLGVSPYSQFGGRMELQIHTVKPGSAADRAGLKVDDLLIKFNGHSVSDFETLVEKIGELQPGDKVPVEYERDGVRETATVELRGWE
jgi:S1-C subfamily serine protease